MANYQLPNKYEGSNTHNSIPNTKKSAGNLGEIFTKRLNQMGIKKQVDAAMLCEAFNEAVLEVFGEKGAENVKAISFKNNTLKVGISSSAWASEVSLNQVWLKKDKNIKIRFEVMGTI